MKLGRCLGLLSIVLVFFVGCSATQEQSSAPLVMKTLTLPEEPFSLLPVPSQQQIFQLSEQQKQDFLDYYHAPENQFVLGHRRLHQYLESILDGFHFQGKTHNASQALIAQSGNCLSLAILTTALAKLVDLEVSYQRVNSAPIYHRYHNVMTLSSHVRTIIYQPKSETADDMLLLRRGHLIIDYFPQSGDIKGDKVAYEDFVAMYFQNLAGDALVKEQFQLAYSLLKKAWQIAPDNPETVNSLAVLYGKIGLEKEAESLYAGAVDKGIASVNVMSNYHLLLTRQNRVKEAKALEVKLADVKDDNPYRWFDVADRQFDKAKYAIALKYYKRALEQAPYLHEGYFGMAKVYFTLGLEKEAKEALNRALELSYVPEEQRLYQSKLKVLEATQED